MLRILLDENVPIGLKGLLAASAVSTAGEMGWAGVANGRLLDAAEASGFQLLVTADRSIRMQQRLASRKIALVVISTNHWDTIRENAAAVRSACDGAREGTYSVVQLPRPPQRRRAGPPPAPR